MSQRTFINHRQHYNYLSFFDFKACRLAIYFKKLKFYYHVLIIHKINILIPQLRNGILIFSPLHMHYDFELNYTKLSIDYNILLIFI